MSTVYHGDCREVLPRLEAESFAVLWTDPPYGHNNHAGDFNARLNLHREIASQPIANDSPDDMRAVVDFVLTEAVRLLNPDCCCCCCGGGGPRPTFAWLALRMDAAGRFRRQHEMIMVAHRSTARLSWRDDSIAIPNIFSAMPPRDRFHPNEKPESLTRWFLEHVTPIGGKVFDPFLGSGTTLVAAKNRGIVAVGCDLEERNCEIAARRLSGVPRGTAENQTLLSV